MKKGLQFLKGIFYPVPLELSNRKEVKRPFRSGLVVSILMLVLIYLAMGVTNFDIQVLIRRGNKF